MSVPYLPADAKKQLNDFKEEFTASRRSLIGFPIATDFDYQEIAHFFNVFMNNVGDPYTQGLSRIDSKILEREVISFFSDLFRAPTNDRWGYMTSGSTEGNLYALYAARELRPGAILYYSKAAHYSIAKNAHILGMQTIVIETQPNGEMDYVDLAGRLQEHADKPAIVVATVGTTMTEARDNVATIKAALELADITDHFIHCDGALAGSYAKFITPYRPFDFEDGADSIAISGYKFFGTPMPCGVVLTRKSYSEVLGRSVAYIGNTDTTISGSRSGQGPLCLWYAIKRWGSEGIRERYAKSLELAEYVERSLRAIGWETWRNEDAITVMLRTPSQELCTKWQLATHDGWSHIICMPGLEKQHLAQFIKELQA